MAERSISSAASEISTTGAIGIVARFHRASSVIKGIARDDDHIAFSIDLAVVGATNPPDRRVAIRQHDIQLSPTAENRKMPSSRGDATGISRRKSRLHGRDSDGTTLRVVTSTETAVPRVPEVWLTLAPNAAPLSR